MIAHMRRAARNLATSSIIVRVEERKPRRKLHVQPGVQRRVDISDGIGQRKRRFWTAVQPASRMW
jgi:hypothetical protein